MNTPRKAIVGMLARYAARLRFPTLLAITASLFVLDLLVPDAIPMVDEILLGLGTILLGSLRRKDAPPAPGFASPNDSSRSA